MVNKKIAFFYGGSDSEYNGKIISGIHAKCKEYGCVLLAFGSLLNNAPKWYGDVLSKYVMDGENSIFELADYEDMDGAIVLGDHFNNDTIENEIIDKCVKFGIPVVLIDGNNENAYNIEYQDVKGMELVVEHLIKKHGFTRINFISGYKDNRESEERLDAYKKALENNNIPYEAKRVDYGWFGGRTTKVMDAFMKSELEFPQAIVCANDTMALETIQYLEEHGKRVPDDVVVTGYDGLVEGQMYYPALTSVRRPLYEAGEKAVELLRDIFYGEKVDSITYVPSVVIENQSCGCKKTERIDMSGFSNLQMNAVNNFKRFNYGMVQFSNDVSRADSIEEIFKCVFRTAYLFDAANMYFCLNSNITDNYESDRINYYAEEMTAYFLGEDNCVHSEKFPQWKLLPEACDRNDGRYTHFYPMYHQEVILGYVAARVDKYDTNSELFYTFLRNVSNSVGDYCIRSEKDYMVNQLKYLSVRDPMTLLYNRRGLIEGANKIIDAQDKRKYIVGICIDMDGLKGINDTYGHGEGDNAIIQLANAILFSRSSDEICSRMGGDEFFIFLNCDDEKEPERIVDKINEFLMLYNKTSGKQYSIECSCGIYIAPADKVKSFETVMKFADRNMYDNKTEKKRRR